MQERSLSKIYFLAEVCLFIGMMTAPAQAGTLTSLGVQQTTPYDDYVASVEHQDLAAEATPPQVLDLSPTLSAPQTLSSEVSRAAMLREVHSEDAASKNDVLIKTDVPPTPKRVEVPEPSVVIGLAAVAGLIALKRQRTSNS